MPPKAAPEEGSSLLNVKEQKILMVMWARQDPDPSASTVDSRKISEQTNIPYNTLRASVQKIRKACKSLLEELDPKAYDSIDAKPKAKISGGGKKRRATDVPPEDDAEEETEENPAKPSKKAKSTKAKKMTPDAEASEDAEEFPEVKAPAKKAKAAKGEKKTSDAEASEGAEDASESKAPAKKLKGKAKKGRKADTADEEVEAEDEDDA